MGEGKSYCRMFIVKVSLLCIPHGWVLYNNVGPKIVK